MHTDYITQHKDEYQIDLDIDRSLKNYNVAIAMKNNKINELRVYLKDILLGMICCDSNFHYYQVLLFLLLLVYIYIYK